MINLKLFPWDNGEEPFHVSETGVEWYVERGLTDWCRNERPMKLPKLNAVSFILRENENAGERVLMSIETNDILHVCTGLEQMATYIDALRISKAGGDKK